MAKVKPIRIYEYNTTSFNNNGLGVLFPSDAIIERNLSEMTYSLSIIHPLDEYGKWELLQEDRIIKANEQLFRIKYVTKTLTSIEAYCEHILFDLQNNFIEDTNIVGKNGNLALNQILDAMVYDHPFPVTATSDIAIVNNSRLVRKNVLTAIIGGDDNSFINRWGGELDIDGFTFCINSRIGQNRGYKISYGKNLTGLDAQFDMTNVCTVIRPIGFDGIELPDNDKYVYSQYVDNYAMPIIREYKYEDVKWVGSPNYQAPSDGTSDAYQTLEEAQSELRRRAEMEFTENKIDIPSATYNINFIELSQTEEYKDYQALAQINIGDDVTITHKRLGINIPARCISYKYNCLTANFDEITLGYYNRSFFSQTMDVINESEFIQTLPDKLNDFLQQAKDQATEILMGGFGG